MEDFIRSASDGPPRMVERTSGSKFPPSAAPSFGGCGGPEEFSILHFRRLFNLGSILNE